MELTVARAVVEPPRLVTATASPSALTAAGRSVLPDHGDELITSPSHVAGFLSGRRPRRLRQPGRTLICAECDLTGGPFEPAEAAHLVTLHDELHHGRRRQVTTPLTFWSVEDDDVASPGAAASVRRRAAS
jgi:hypothetical protein